MKVPKGFITQAERLQLIGLAALAEDCNAKLKDIERAVLAITNGEDGGLWTDVVYGMRVVDEVIDLSGIKVVAADPAAELVKELAALERAVSPGEGTAVAIHTLEQFIRRAREIAGDLPTRGGAA
jgi:hypothetical protein